MADDLKEFAALINNPNANHEILDKLRGLLGMPNSGRSPAFKPLRDLRAPATQKGRLNRPHFEWSADDDGTTVIPPFPRLYWDERGVERRIENEDDLVRLVGKDWTDRPPMAHAQTEKERAEAMLAMLSPEDRQFVLEAQQKTRLERIREQLSGLSPADIAAIMTANAPTELPTAPVEVKASKKTA